eukprot:TRINITY_DN76142_c0_g1_i1.p1 TRINITY_DN76142_c0_g1~~TRINITY_DN76142_c0_g1_i1.p1  ORF type:complete len:328 (+),score=35.67 TRINITY_DN76142_c0_g1_i1:192-1175(+)
MTANSVTSGLPREHPLDGVPVLACIGMSTLAGLSTTLGAGVVFLMPGKRVPPRQMAFALSLAAGVMISVTVLEFWLPLLTGGKQLVPVFAYSAFGALCFFLLSRLVPEPELTGGVGHGHSSNEPKSEVGDVEFQVIGNVPSDLRSDNGDAEVDVFSKPHTAQSLQEFADDERHERGRKLRLASVLMVSLTAHNFPEGFAVATSAFSDERLGLVVMFAIAIHNIPEGIAIAVPVLSATGDVRRAVGMAFLSGMAEPVGASCALLLLRLVGGVSESTLENLLCTVGGVMCAVSFQELLPEALRYGQASDICCGLTVGFITMLSTKQLGA